MTTLKHSIVKTCCKNLLINTWVQKEAH